MQTVVAENPAEVKDSSDESSRSASLSPVSDNGDRRTLILLSGGHFTVDMCQGVLPLTLPSLLQRLHLDYTATALIVTTMYLTSSIVQPLFGCVRNSAILRTALVVGPALACLFLALAAQSTSYPLVIVCVVLSSLGIAMYHPEAVARANAASGTARKGRGMSTFALSGSMGFSLGALFFGPLIAWGGLPTVWLMLVPGLLFSVLIGQGVRRTVATGQTVADVSRVSRSAWLPMALLVGVVALRQWTIAGTMTFLPLYYTHDLKASAAMASGLIFALQLGGDAGTLSSGLVGERWGYRNTILYPMIVACPLLLLYWRVSGPGTIAALFLAGVALSVPMLATTLMGQETLPNRKALAASLTLGFGVGIGGIGSGLLGRLGDAKGLPTVLTVLAIAPLVAVAFAMAIPKQPRAESA